MAVTGLAFQALSARALSTQTDLGLRGCFLLAGMVIALVTSPLSLFGFSCTGD